MKTRLISAAIAIPLGILVIFLNSIHLYRIVIGVLSSVAVYELLVSAKILKYRVLSAISLIFSFCLPFVLSVEFIKEYALLYYFTYLVFMFAFLLSQSGEFRFEKLTFIAFLSICIPLSFSCVLFSVLQFGKHATFAVLLILISAWVGDAGAYFVGTFLGKHKMAPNISPKKTWEGFAGGIVTSGIAAIILCSSYEMYDSFAQGALTVNINVIYVVLISVCCSALGVIGDFSASVIKRQFYVKDFGNVMPGHGGVLDRFDSVLFAAPFIYLVFKLYFPVIDLI